MLLLVIGLTAMAQQRTKAPEPQWTSIISNSPETFQTQLISSTENSIKVNVKVPGFYTTAVTTPRGEAYVITVPKSVSTAQAGEPDMPMTGIPIMIGDKARMKARVIDAQYMDFENIEVAPSKGDFPRSIDPATVPYTYGECYSQDAFFPASNVGLYDPYIIRDLRGQNIVIYPFAYNPVTKTLRVYYNMTVEMYKEDDHGTNIIATRHRGAMKLDPDFKSLYQRHFINYDASMDRYTPVDEEGDLLIICYDNFISSMTDFVNWKKTRGVNTTIVGTSTAGSTYSAIKTYIQNQYNANNNLTHVLLVGDVAQIPGYSYTGGGSSYGGLGDNAYGQIVGSDYYNDVFIGRFSAQTAAQVTTQVNRVITYERDLTTSDTWLQNADGIARNEGGSGHNGEDDYEHMDVIRTDLLNYGYNTVYQDYENLSGYTGTASSISSHINSGVGIVNYCNHGNNQLWGVASYSNTQVNNLTNKNKLPFIWSVACLVGKYDNTSTSYGGNYTIGQSNDCFAEAWMHATYSSSDLTPTGAVGALMSYISQPWIPPMWAQDECVDILAGLSNSGGTKHTWGGVSINGLFGIFDNYGTDQSAVGTYQAWILYGDPSMMLRTKTPQAMTVTHNGSINVGTSVYTVNVNNGNGCVATITDANHNILGKATVSNGTANISISGDLTPGTELTLCVFGFNKVTYLGTIQVITINGPYISLESHTPNTAIIDETTNLSLTFKNVGNAATSGTTTVTLTSSDATFGVSSRTFSALAANATTTVNGFSFSLNNGVTLGSAVVFHYTAVNGSNTWEGDFTIIPDQIFTVNVASNNNNYGTVSGGGQVHYNAPCTVTATPADGYMFINWTQNGNVVSTEASYTFNVTSNVSLVANFTEGVMIGSGTSTSDYLPSYNYYKYALSEQIYTSAELGGAGLINSIAFYNGGAEKTRNYDFYLKATTKNSFTGKTDWITVSSGDKVFSGEVTMVADDWTTIILSTPFVYDGTSNIVLVADDNSGEYTSSPHMSCRVFTTTSNQALYYYDDSNNFNPMSPPTTSGNYNAVLSSKNQIIITKEPISNEPVNITVSANPAQAATVSGGGEYVFGQTCTVTATPNTGYLFMGWTENGTIVSSELSYIFTAVADRNLVANFTQAIEIGQGTTTHTNLPSYNYYKYSMTEQIYTADEIGTAGTINSIAFYNEGAEKTRTYDFYLKATTKSSFSSKTDWVTVAASDKVFSGSVTMVANAWTFINFTTPFEYDGTSNLVLVADDNSGAYTNAPHMACSVFNTNGNQTIYIYSDGTNYNPLSPTTSQSSSYDVLAVKNHILMGIESSEPEPCLAPTNLAASNIDYQSALLSWNGEADSWKVAYKTSTASQFTEVSVNTNSYTLTELLPEMSYTVKVAAVCGDETVWCEPISFTTLPMPCPAPTALTAANVTGTTASLSWTETGSATSWVLQYGTDDAFANGTYAETIVNGTPAADLVDLTAETEYYARVKSTCSANNQSDWSNICTFFPSIYVVIGSGTGTNNYLPTNVNNKYSMTQQIYTAEELGEAGNIVSLDFYKNNNAVSSRKLDIYMVSTDKSSYAGSNDWIPVTAADKVFSGTVNFNDNAWTTITLARPFRYEGTSNIAIVVDDNTGLAKSSTPFLVFPASNQSIRISGNSTNYNVVSASNYTGTVMSTKNQMRIVKGESGPDCPEPTDVAVSVTGRHSAVVSWTENGEADAWVVAYRPATENIFTEVEVSDNTYTMTGLSIETNYVVKVRPVCDNVTESWSEEKTFVTESCYTISPDAQESGKWTEDFDSYTTSTATETGVQPDCWEVLIPDATLTSSTKPQLYRGYATSGSYSLRMKNRCLYAMPSLDEDVPVNALQMKFNLRQPNAIYRLQVGVVNENGVFTVVKTINNASTGKEPVTVDFTDYSGGGHRIAFRNTLANGSNLAYSYNYIDDIEIGYANSCEIAVLQYTENFDSYTTTTATETGVQPDCWEVITEDVALTEATMPQLYRGYATSGSYSLRMKNRCVYAMRPLSANINVGDLTMTFNLRQAKSIYRLQVGVLNENGEFTVVKTLKCSNTSNMEAKTVNFSGYTGNRIAFRNTLVPGTGMSTDYLDYSVNYIDNIHLDYTTVSKQDANAVDALAADLDQVDVMVYPNPTKDVVNVQCTMNNAQCSGIEIVDVYGKIITTVGTRFIASAQFPASAPTQINVSGLAAGMYFVRVTTDRGVVTKPFVKR